MQFYCGSVLFFGVVLRMPCRGRFMWPFAVAGLGFRYFKYQFFGDVGAPFEETFTHRFEERGYLWVAQGLVCEFYLVCLC